MLTACYMVMMNCYFNPRTPYGMRPCCRNRNGNDGMISIHAPLTGCDWLDIKQNHDILYFNPRTPYGMRRKDNGVVVRYAKFQSTHPLRDATNSFRCVRKSLYISIHAPLTGCDLSGKVLYNSANDFNPRTPYGMRLYSKER